MVLVAGIFDPRESANQALNLSCTGVLALYVEDVVLHLEWQLLRIVMGKPNSVGQPLNPAFVVAIENFMPVLREIPNSLHSSAIGSPADERQTAFSQPSPTTPSKASLPP
jgi:hypothetical protein